jgi:hypothetical protein
MILLEYVTGSIFSPVFVIAIALACLCTFYYSIFTPKWLARVWLGAFSIYVSVYVSINVVVWQVVELSRQWANVAGTAAFAGFYLLYWYLSAGGMTPPEPDEEEDERYARELFKKVMNETISPYLSRITEKLDKLPEMLKERIKTPPSEDELEKLAKQIAGHVMKHIEGYRELTDEEIHRIADRVSEVIQGATAQREGISFQLESAQDLEVLGFKVVNSEGRDKPDHLLYSGDKLVAMGSAKSLSIKDSWTLNTERAGKIEIEVARGRNLPLVVNIRNKENGREWACVIEPKDVQTDFTITAPSWLWKPKLTAAEEREMEASHREAGERLRQLLGPITRTLRRRPYE